MDNRIAQVEQMIADYNAHALSRKQLSLKSAQDWKNLLETIRRIQMAALTELPEVKDKEATVNAPDLVCSKCGMPLKAGVKFCKHCGTRADIPVAVPQEAPAGLCACGAKIVKGAKFCRQCGKPVH